MRFARDLVLENAAGQASLKAMRRRLAEHEIETIGEKLRAMMPWIAANKLVDKAKKLAARRKAPRRRRATAVASATARARTVRANYRKPAVV